MTIQLAAKATNLPNSHKRGERNGDPDWLPDPPPVPECVDPAGVCSVAESSTTTVLHNSPGLRFKRPKVEGKCIHHPGIKKKEKERESVSQSVKKEEKWKLENNTLTTTIPPPFLRRKK